MSFDSIRLIPTSPEYVPDVLMQERAIELLRSLFPALGPQCEITAKVTEYVEFVDQGSNFERILCPFCLTELTIPWWHSVMDKAYEGRFADLRVRTPCCDVETSLNELRYEWPAGFGRFVIELFEPFVLDASGVWEMIELDQDALGRLGKVLGCRVRVIWAHH